MRNNKYSDLKIAAHPDKLRSFREGRVTAPIYVRVKPCNSCNHGCHWCVYKADRRLAAVTGSPDSMDSGMHAGMKEADEIPTAKMLEVLEDFRDMGVKAVTFSGGGEPLLHRDITLFMQRCLYYGIDLSLITNGQLLNNERAEVLAFAKWVRVSMDYTTPEQMARSRRVPERLYGQVMMNLQTFARLKQPFCDLGVNFIVTRENHADLVPFARQMKELGVENVRFSPVYCPLMDQYHAPHEWAVLQQLETIQAELVDEDFSVNTTFDLDNPAHRPERAYTRCYFMQTVPVVGADQNVYACHNKAYDPGGLIGSIAGDMRFKDLWGSEAARAVFESLNPQCACQHQCANDAKNRHIMNLVSSQQDNFV
jgi:MoaA/NifB/PqqE/SkfB family radical SAM enzyme